MNHRAISIRPFIGATNYDLSRRFYRDLGFEEKVLSSHMTVFKKDAIAFYLQHAYVKDWIDNSMIFVEVDDVDRCWQDLVKLDLPARYENVRLTPIRNDDWEENVSCTIRQEYCGISESLQNYKLSNKNTRASEGRLILQ